MGTKMGQGSERAHALYTREALRSHSAEQWGGPALQQGHRHRSCCLEEEEEGKEGRREEGGGERRNGEGGRKLDCIFVELDSPEKQKWIGDKEMA